VLGEQFRHQLAAARRTDLVEHRLDVVADGVDGQVQLRRDVGGYVAGASLEEFLATADRYGFWNSISD
jgi:hypothetical protein